MITVHMNSQGEYEARQGQDFVIGHSAANAFNELIKLIKRQGATKEPRFAKRAPIREMALQSRYIRRRTS